MEERFVCPCCGWRGLMQPAYEQLKQLPVPTGIEPPYSEYFGMPSYEVCDCCGFEFGNDDEPGIGKPASFRAYLDEWVADGEKWFSAEKRPASWSLSVQLKAAALRSLK
jgi:hypothetical protein